MCAYRRHQSTPAIRYRLGASGPVKVIRLVAKDTVEEALLNLTVDEERRRRLGTFMAARQSDAAAHTHRARTLSILKTLRFVPAPPDQAAAASDAASADAAASTVVRAAAAQALSVGEDTSDDQNRFRPTFRSRGGKARVTFAAIPHPSLHGSDSESDEG